MEKPIKELDLFKEEEFLSKDMLIKLPTHRLLSYYKSIRPKRFRENYEWLRGHLETTPEIKYYADLKEYLDFIKDLLNSKEHIAKKSLRIN